MTEIAQIDGLPPKQEAAVDPARITQMLPRIERAETFGADMGIPTQRELNTAPERALQPDETRRLGGMGIYAA